MNPLSNSEQLKDVDLVALVKEGNRDSFDLLVQRHQAAVSGVAYAICGDFAMSEDIAQEAFLSAWTELGNLRSPERFRAWVCGIARQLSLSHVRKKSRRGDFALDGTIPESVSAEAGPQELAATEEEKQMLWRVLDSLPETYREPLVLFYREQESVASVADALDLSEETVKQRLSRGRALVRDTLAKQLEGILRSTRPGPLFTAAVLGALPATLAGAGLLVGASSAKAATGVGAGASLGSQATVGGLHFTGAAFATVLSSLVGLLWAYVGFRILRAPWVPPASRRAFKTIGIQSAAISALFAAFTTWIAWTRGDSLLRWGLSVGPVVAGVILVMAAAQLIVTLQAVRKLQDIHGGQMSLLKQRYPTLDSALICQRRYTSSASFLGLPLLQVAYGPDATKGEAQGTAKGWIALGDRAWGALFAMGGFAFAPISLGGFSLGLLSIGGMSLGGLTFGGLCIGWSSFGGIALAWQFAAGGVALANWGSVGGLSLAHHWAIGGCVFAAHANDSFALSEFRRQEGFQTLLRYLPYSGLLTLLGIPSLLRLWSKSR